MDSAHFQSMIRDLEEQVGKVEDSFVFLTAFGGHLTRMSTLYTDKIHLLEKVMVVKEEWSEEKLLCIKQHHERVVDRMKSSYQEVEKVHVEKYARLEHDNQVLRGENKILLEDNLQTSIKVERLSAQNGRLQTEVENLLGDKKILEEKLEKLQALVTDQKMLEGILAQFQAFVARSKTLSSGATALVESGMDEAKDGNSSASRKRPRDDGSYVKPDGSDA